MPIRTSGAPARGKSKNAKRNRLSLERLESRDLMSASPNGSSKDNYRSLMCMCPVCTGVGLPVVSPDSAPVGALANTAVGALPNGSAGANVPISSVPVLNSLPSATAQLYLDFNGGTTSNWAQWTTITSKPFSTDSDLTTFSPTELDVITEVWRRVAEDYAPFNINVTTVDPGNLTDKVTAKVQIGGSYSDWLGSAAGGIAFIGGFNNGAPNTGFVFSESLSNSARYVAEATSHEAGHLFGLLHQSSYSGTTKTAEYNQGDANWAPIMGNSYYATATTWANGQTSSSSTDYQDNMAVIAGSANGFGYRADNNNSLSTASVMSAPTGTFSYQGVVAQNTDQDWYQFTAAAGDVTLNVNTVTVGANLDSVLELRNSAGTLITTADSSTSFNSTITRNLAAGTYYAVVRSTGVYGRVGQYTFSGTYTQGTTGQGEQTPQITTYQGTTRILNGTSSVNFNSTTAGTEVLKTFAVYNDGNATLTLNPISASNVPSGFSIASNFDKTSLAPTDHAVFTLRLSSSTAGSYSGTVSFTSNDPDDSPFSFNVSGTVTAQALPRATVYLGNVMMVDGTSNVDFGTIASGASSDRTFRVYNDGNANLTLTAISASGLPAGFSILSNFDKTTLTPGQFASFTIRFSGGSQLGSYSGSFSFNSNDPNQSPFDLGFAGTQVSAPIQVRDNGQAWFATYGTGWTSATGGRGGSQLVASRGSGEKLAAWTFDSLEAGTYRVSATWSGNRRYATNSPFYILDDQTVVGFARVNQEVSPRGFAANGSTWADLGRFQISSGKIVVLLTNLANDSVAADAIRIEKIASAAAVPNAPDSGVGAIIATAGRGDSHVRSNASPLVSNAPASNSSSQGHQVARAYHSSSVDLNQIHHPSAPQQLTSKSRSSRTFRNDTSAAPTPVGADAAFSTFDRWLS